MILQNNAPDATKKFVPKFLFGQLKNSIFCPKMALLDRNIKFWPKMAICFRSKNIF